MANDLSKIPWIIDTAGATAIFTGTIGARVIRWVGATTAGHRCVVQDGAGHDIWDSTADGDKFNDQMQVPLGFVWKGLIVPTLQSGVLYLY